MVQSASLLSAAGGVAEAGAPAASAAGDAAVEAADKAPRAKANLANQLAEYLDLDGVLSCYERLWPQWADNGCRMIELVRPHAK